MQNYNWLYLRGDEHITDERYQELMLEDGVAIPDWDLHTVKVNNHYISLNPEKNQAYLNKLLAKHGLYGGENG